MDIKAGWNLAINVAQEADELCAPMAAFELTNDFTCGNIQGCK